jgi:hypothetical protein
MFNSLAYNAVLRELCDNKKLATRWTNGQNLQNNVINAVKRIGALRFWSQETGKNISFKRLDFSKFLDPISLAIDVPKFVAHINGHQLLASQERTKETGKHVAPNYINVADFAAAERLVKKAPYASYFANDLLLCRGHDIMEVLAILLKKVIGNSAASKIAADDLERSFRLSFIAHWNNTKLLLDIKSWFTASGLHKQLI